MHSISTIKSMNEKYRITGDQRYNYTKQRLERAEHERKVIIEKTIFWGVVAIIMIGIVLLIAV